MERIKVNRPRWLVNFSLAARIMALLCSGFVLFTIISEGFQGHPVKGADLWSRDYFLMAVWLAYLAGLLIGLKWEGLGALVSLAALISYLLYLSSEDTGSGPWIGVMFIPCALYLLSWYFHRRNLQYK